MLKQVVKIIAIIFAEEGEEEAGMGGGRMEEGKSS